MKYQWGDDPKGENSRCLTLNLNKRFLRLDNYPTPYHSDRGDQNPSIIKELMEIDGVEYVVVVTQYEIHIGVAQLSDKKLVKQEVVEIIHKALDPEGELVEVAQ